VSRREGHTARSETLRPTPTTRPWRARTLAVVAAVLAALAVWLVTGMLLGVDLAAPTRPGSEQLQSITPALVAATSLVIALAGWGLLALLERFTARPCTIWTAIAVLIPGLAATAPSLARPAPARERNVVP
jgi:hypothetical protein